MKTRTRHFIVLLGILRFFNVINHKFCMNFSMAVKISSILLSETLSIIPLIPLEIHLVISLRIMSVIPKKTPSAVT